MNPDDVLKWVSVWNSLLGLGVPIAKLVLMFRAMLTEEDLQRVLLAVKQGWANAAAENNARIAELEALADGGGSGGL